MHICLNEKLLNQVYTENVTTLKLVLFTQTCTPNSVEIVTTIFFLVGN